MAVLALATGCSRDEPRQRNTTIPGWPAGDACMTALAQRGIDVAVWPAPTSGGCAVEKPVMPAGIRPRLEPPPRVGCSMLFAWASFEPIVDELARRHLGAGLRSVQSYGSHACRRMTGNRGRLSLHASGKALDIGAFDLTDGERISVQEDWESRGARGRFLRAVAQAACERFSAVLTPDTDRFHQDHLHLDIGPWRVCDA
jgi:hypothetical protein